MQNWRLVLSALAIVLVLSTVTATTPPSLSFAEEEEGTPGTNPASQDEAKSQSSSSPFAAPGSGLVMVEPDPTVGATFSGKGGYSADALGQSSPGGTLQAEVPAGSTVEQAYLYGSTFEFKSPPCVDTINVTIDSTVLTLDNLDHNGFPHSSGFGLCSYREDVTSLAAAKIGSGGGITDFAVNSDFGNLDGVGLVVIYSNPSSPDNTIAILDGGVSPDGATTIVGLAQPLDKTVPGFSATLSLGIGFSFQSSINPHLCLGGFSQHSNVDVNGERLTECAGHWDDGFPGNGGLITIGGVGDNFNNPEVPPVSGSEDDELYDISSFLEQGDTQIEIVTDNPTDDDNIFLAIIAITAKASVGEICGDGIDNDQDGLTDEGCNTAPDAVDDSAETAQDVPVVINVLANDNDSDGDALTVDSTTDPADGSVANNGDGTVTYTPNPAFTGSDSFTYSISDGNGGTDSATVTVRVRPEVVDGNATCFNAIPTIVGTQDDDVILGTQGDDVIVGLGGNDIIAGFGGNDIICGGDGDDKLSGGGGEDVVIAGNGDDYLFGGKQNDRLIGNEGNDRLFGSFDNDNLEGGDGDDNLFGQEGSDNLTGGPGTDRLDGGLDDDTDKCIQGEKNFNCG